jgi:ribosomal protein S18 acetylase RimI-like enzyme
MHVTWYDEHLRDGMVELVRAVSATGGAVGWLTVPPPEDVDVWLASVLQGGSRLAVAVARDQVLACGYWRRQDAVVLAGMAEISKVMTHPNARGRGAAAAVMEVLLDDAAKSGVELLTLDCRGNNHAAQRLYSRLGFQVTGRRPDAIGIGEERFDQVLMHLDLRSGTSGLVRHGSRNEGLGAT